MERFILWALAQIDIYDNASEAKVYTPSNNKIKRNIVNMLNKDRSQY